jgi:hypothetical protein
MNVCMCVHMHTFISFPFSGQPCINDDEEMKEVDLAEPEAESGCSQPPLPENAFTWVSVLNVTLGLKFKKRT